MVNSNLKKVYEVASDIIKFPEFLKGYKKVDVLDNEEKKKALIKVLFDINGREVEFHCLANFAPGKSNNYEHVTGPLKGMRVTWEFRRRLKRIKVSIRHDFPKILPPIFEGVGPLPKENLTSLLNKSAQGILAALKRRCEV
jgi:ribosome-associated toxin RatA of RatAB toxin-antitoxin module